jgi:hypothetical protein
MSADTGIVVRVVRLNPIFIEGQRDWRRLWLTREPGYHVVPTAYLDGDDKLTKIEFVTEWVANV